MLFYSSVHPDWDYFGSFQRSKKGQDISALLEAVAMNHPRNTTPCFEQLEQLGIILGSGGFESILIQQDPYGVFDPSDHSWAETVLTTAKTVLDIPIWYCFSVSGRLYVLCCFPRLREGMPETKQVENRLYEQFAALVSQLQPDHPAMRVIVSDIQFEETGIFRNFNNLHHAMEYYDFLDFSQTVIQLSAEQQLHDAFIGNLSVYRQFSVAIAERLSREDCDPGALAREVCDMLLNNSVPSIESVHHHIQIFMLTFTDYLGSSGLVDAAYMTRHNIVYRAMGFERETGFRANMAEIMEDLHQQNKTLRAIGKQKRIQSIREYVEQNIHDPDLTVAGISERFHVSTTQASKQFRYYFGISLHRFLQQTRFRYAQGLIETHPDWPMHQVAAAAGYTDLSTMYRAFRQLGNVTPAALRDSLVQHKST